MSSSMNGRERVFTFCYENLAWGYTHPEQAKIVLLTYYYQSLYNKGSKPGQEAFKLGGDRLKAHCLQAERENLVRFNGDIQMFSEMVHEYAAGLFVRMVATGVSGSKNPPTDFRLKINLFLDQFMFNP